MSGDLLQTGLLAQAAAVKPDHVLGKLGRGGACFLQGHDPGGVWLGVTELQTGSLRVLPSVRW